MKKRLAAALLCLLLILSLSPAPPARAAGGSVCFMAAGDSILPLSDATMPFWYNGVLYIDSAVFTSETGGRGSLRVARTFNNNDSQLILYGGGRSLWFEQNLDHGYDLDGGSYYPGCQIRNGRYFVPAAVVAKFFDLLYSVTDVQLQSEGQRVRGSLVWLRRPGFIMEDEEFFAAATFAIASRYEDYIREKESQAEEAEPDPELPEPPDAPEYSGQSVFLCLEAGDSTAGLLDVLDRRHVQAAFFCTPAFLESQGSLLRRMTATGHSIGILVEGSDPERGTAEQLELGNQALERATCGRTRLAFLRNGSAAQLRTAQELGFRCLEPGLDRSGYGLRNTSGASNLLRRISGRRGNVSVWLGDAVTAAGLRALLSGAEELELQYLAWTETS